MKKKTLKLNFSKSTVANLDLVEQNNIKGGIYTDKCKPSFPMYISCLDKWCQTELLCPTPTEWNCNTRPC